MSDLYDIPGIDGPDLATLPRDDDDGCHHPDECLIEYCGNCMDEHFKQHIELKAEVERLREALRVIADYDYQVLAEYGVEGFANHVLETKND